MPEFELEYAGRRIRLTKGEFVVGRSTDCNLSLDDPLVSRRHAVFRVRGQALTVEDLGSRNGVQVNRESIHNEVTLAFGDVVTIGKQAFRVVEAVGPPRAFSRSVTAVSIEESRASTVLGMRADLLEKAFAIGRIENVENILTTITNNALTQAGQRALDPELAAELTSFSLRLATTTSKAHWVDQVFVVYRAAQRVLPAATIEALHAAVRKARYTITPAFRSYMDWIEEQGPTLSPTERFALQRLEGLAQMLRS